MPTATLNDGAVSRLPTVGSPQITSLSPSSIAAGTPGLILTVTGSNFSNTSLSWNGTPVTTLTGSATELQAEIPSALLTAPGTVNVVPYPLAPNGAGTRFTITQPPVVANPALAVSMSLVAANDIVWDAKAQQLYVSVASDALSSGNTITALDPTTAQLGSSVSTGSSTGRLALSSDSTYLYVGLDDKSIVQRYTLPGLTADISIPLGSVSYGPYYAIDVETDPADPRAVAIARGVATSSPMELGGIGIYDDGVPRPTSVPGLLPNVSPLAPGPIDSLVWSDSGTSIYGVNTEDIGGFVDLYVLSVGSSGVQVTNDFRSDTNTEATYGKYLHFDKTTGYLYTDEGQILDPKTGTAVASFPLSNVKGGFDTPTVMVPDGILNIAYFLGETTDDAGSHNYTLAAFDLTKQTLLGTASVGLVFDSVTKMVRWGTNGLAFFTNEGSGARPGHSPSDGVYILSGSFVVNP